MGALHTHRLTTAPLALALLLALASSTSSGNSSTAGAGAGATPVSPGQAAASVTNDAEMSAAAAELSEAKPEPAIRVAATGDLADPITRVQVPDVLLAAYRTAAAGAPAACHLPVSLLAAIGEVESGSLVGRELDSRHRTSILGPVLDGNGFAAVPDTDGGKWDGDTKWDRAMGPMQFIPGTWRTFGVDGDGDGVADPQDVEDAAAATAAYLCYGGRDLSKPADLGSAVLAYNHSTSYQQLVLTYQRRYAGLGLDQSGSVTGLSTPVSLVTMQSLGVVEGSPSVGATRTGAVRTRAARTHRPARPTRPAGQHATRPTRPGEATEPTKPSSDEHVPSASPTPSATAAASPTPSTPSASPSTSPSGSPTPTPTPTTSPTPSPTPAPTPAPSPTPSPSPTHTPTPTTTPSPTASPTPVPIDPETGCPLVEVQEDGAVDTDGEPCLPCVPTTDPSEYTSAVDGREVACVVEEPTS